jgi:hypothetical protein
MAPSILSLCGLSAPADWDGQTLGALAAGTVDAPANGDGAVVELAYDDATERDLQKRLEQLGYLA